MAPLFHIAQPSDPHFCATHRAGVPLVIQSNSDGVDQIVVPKSGGFGEILIRALYDTLGWPPSYPKTDSCIFPKSLVTQAA